MAEEAPHATHAREPLPKLVFEGVWQRYAKVPGARTRDSNEGTLALEDLSFSVAPGEAVALIGPSGCGKSSALRMAAGLMQPTCGRVLVDGSPVEQPRQKTALILQDFGLLPWKTVRENAELGLKIRRAGREERRARAAEALELVGLSDFAESYPGGLSGGMKQRLALARSLALEVDLLLMDEPLSALDALLREQLQDTLLELWQREGYAQVLVTHSIEEAVYLGQRILVLSPRPGHVVAEVENPGAGEREYRGSGEYFARVKEVRACLRSASGQPLAASPASQEVASHA